MNLRNLVMACLCSVGVQSAVALSMGQAHGRVLLGQPIDVSFDVHLDPGMALEAVCLSAKMISGENPLGPGLVQVTPLPSVPGRGPAVRVQSSRQADEPVLTVQLSAGCTGTISRTYVFLADLPESVAPSTTPIAIPRVESEERTNASDRGLTGGGGLAADWPTQPGRSAPVRMLPEQGAKALQPAAAVETPPPVRKARPAQVPAALAKPRPARPPAVAASKPQSTGARLVMEPLSIVLTPAAGASAEASAPVAAAASAPEGMAPSAAEAASAAQPGVAPGELQPTAVLTDELAALRMQAASDRAQALALQMRLERIESERFHPGVVYGLLGLLAVMLAWMVWQVLRFRTAFEQSSRAWSESVAVQGAGKQFADE